MKKISYNLRIGIVANKEYYEDLFLDNLRDFTISSKVSEYPSEFFLIYKQIPIRLLIFFAESLEEIIYNSNNIEKLDVLILTVNLAETNSLYQYYKNIIDDFNEIYYFQGISLLVGIDTAQIFKKEIPKAVRISRYSLKDTAKYLNLLYCYEIYNRKSDVVEIYKKIFDDFAFRFRYSNSELFEQAKIYGSALIQEGKKNINSL